MLDCRGGVERGGDADIRKYAVKSATQLIDSEIRINDQRNLQNSRCTLFMRRKLIRILRFIISDF